MSFTQGYQPHHGLMIDWHVSDLNYNASLRAWLYLIRPIAAVNVKSCDQS